MVEDLLSASGLTLCNKIIASLSLWEKPSSWWKRRTSHFLLMLPFLSQRFRERMQRRIKKNAKQLSFGRFGLRLPGPSREVTVAAIDLIREFAASEPSLALLQREQLDALPIRPDLPEALAQGWRSLYLTLDHVPRNLLIVPSLDRPQLRQLILCLCNQAIASGDPSALLVVSVDESLPSTGDYLPYGVTWRSLSEFRTDLDFRDKVAILTALIHGLRPQAVLVLESRAGWEVIAQHGVAMCQYAGLFAAFVSPAHGSWEVRSLLQCLPSLTTVYVNDQERFKKLAARQGRSPKKFHLLPTGASDGEWVTALSQEPGFLAKKKAPRP